MEIDKKTITEICYAIYCQTGGYMAVLDLVNTLDEHHMYHHQTDDDYTPLFKWMYCESCCNEMPTFKDSCCLVCGQ